jgi:peroxiredoxin Q/BCP
MPVELRKRKAVEPAPAPPAKKKNPVAKVADKIKEAITGSPKSSKTNGAEVAAPAKVAVGETIALEGFGGEIETHDGQKTTLKKLVEESKAGVVLFTYPKASTPGCTTQACLFRDSYTPLTATGFSIFGLSTDSPTANTTFKTKQKLPYTLLCDPKVTLISAIGLKKAPKGTTRGVFVIDKAGKVLAAQPGSPAGTHEVVQKLVGGAAPASAPATIPAAEPTPLVEDAGTAVESEKVIEEPKVEEAQPATNGLNGTSEATTEDVAKANVAADVADTAEKLDSNEAAPAPVSVPTTVPLGV